MIAINLPKISIITITYNCGIILYDTINSIIEQTYPNIEYIVIDGASTDGTKEIIKNYELRIMNREFPNIVSFKFISEPDKGIYDAMNKGVDIATGEWINFMNAGDSFVFNNVIKDIFSKVLKNSDIIYGNTICKFKEQKYLVKPKAIKLILKQMPFCHQSSFTKTTLLKHNIFDISYKISADYNFFYYAYKNKKKFQYVDINVAIYENESGVSSNVKQLLYENLKIQGCTDSIIGQIKFKLKAIVIYIKKIVKKYLPNKIVHKIRYIKYKNNRYIN